MDKFLLEEFKNKTYAFSFELMDMSASYKILGTEVFRCKNKKIVTDFDDYRNEWEFFLDLCETGIDKCVFKFEKGENTSLPDDYLCNPNGWPLNNHSLCLRMFEFIHDTLPYRIIGEELIRERKKRKRNVLPEKIDETCFTPKITYYLDNIFQETVCNYLPELSLYC